MSNGSLAQYSDEEDDHKRIHFGYDKLDKINHEDDFDENYEFKASRRNNLTWLSPAALLGCTSTKTNSIIVTPEVKMMRSTTTTKSRRSHPHQEEQGKVEAKKLAKAHPIFNFLDMRKSKKAMAKPEFLRYIEYLKDGGNGLKPDNGS